MSKQVNKTAIGAFVVGAMVLAVTGVVVFGSGKFFTEKSVMVAYFEGSVKGLNVGAPVTFRGVKIGEVTDVRVNINTKDLSFWIPVVFEIDRDRLEEVGSGKKLGEGKLLPDLIDRGIRAQLQVQSLVTGQLLVDLDFYPDSPVRLIGTEMVDHKVEHPEMPTITTGLQRISKTIEQLPLDDIIHDISSTLNGIEQVVNSPKITEGIADVNRVLKDVQQLVRNLDRRLEPLGENLGGTLADVRQLVQNVDRRVEPVAVGLEETVKATRKLMQNIDRRTQPLAQELKTSVEAAHEVLQRAEKTLATIDIVAGEGSQLRFDLSDTLNEISGAARSLRILADYLQKNPDALLRGKSSPGGR
ncbi:MAG: MCE family protein [Desulfobacterales bacterium]|nr:MAG: MCE family protein [Desulfobacterales bacterium]